MQHFIGILSPREDLPDGDDRQKPFFGPELRLTRTDGPGRDADDVEARRASREAYHWTRFTSLLSPPFI